MPTAGIGISIHPPRVGWDAKYSAAHSSACNFNPPTPCGVGPSGSASGNIEEYFNPPTPCGVGLLLLSCGIRGVIFQSTHPVWGGTFFQFFMICILHISIHPPRVGWDGSAPCPSRRPRHFNPPTPCGVGRYTQRDHIDTYPISIHPPRVGWDPQFQPAPKCH